MSNDVSDPAEVSGVEQLSGAHEVRPGGEGSILSRWGSRGTALILGIGGLVMLLLGATIGLAIDGNGSLAVAVSADGQDAVDTGFARDMVVHHTQGVLMAQAAVLDTNDKEIRIMASDIQYTQSSQIGGMLGWLDLWGVPRITGDAHMAWMGSTGMADMNMVTSAAGSASVASAASDRPVMPGMATNAEITKLQGLKGEASDIYFLQLMIRHHQGGAAMMTYAANHAASGVVRNFASKMLEAQTSEVGQMTGMLTTRGAQPLPFTAPTG